MKLGMSIKGLQRLQAANYKAIAALSPRGAMGRAIQTGTAMMHRFAVYWTPWDTGSLRASHRMKIERGGLRGVISIDPSAMNPRSRTAPREYGYYLHQQGPRPGLRGGIREFYGHAVETHAPTVLRAMADELMRGLP